VTNEQPAPSKGLHIALWVVQGLLCTAFLFFGGMKFFLTAEMIAKQTGEAPNMALVRFIGTAEVLGALGMILPAASRIMPKLTGIAAIGLLIIMVLATALHVSKHEWQNVPVPVLLGVMAAFVAWGRLKAAPISPKNKA
jgi:putative oxidoreductase